MTTAFVILKKQPQLIPLIHQVVRNHRLGHAYIFEGMAGTGQMELAIYISALLFCMREDKPCGECDHCQRIIQSDFPDVERVQPEGETLKINQIRELKKDLSLTGLESNQKVFIVEDADKMTLNAANSLLKFIEEPESNRYIFLLTQHPENILKTIQSRCQKIHLLPLPMSEIQQHLLEQGISKKLAWELSALTQDISLAKELAQKDEFLKQDQLVPVFLKYLLYRDPRALSMITSEFLKGSREKGQLKTILSLLLFYFRDLVYLKLGDPKKEKETLIHPTEIEFLHKLEPLFSPLQLTTAMTLIAKAERMYQANVSVQSVLEYLVLKIWQIQSI